MSNGRNSFDRMSNGLSTEPCVIRNSNGIRNVTLRGKEFFLCQRDPQGGLLPAPGPYSWSLTYFFKKFQNYFTHKICKILRAAHKKFSKKFAQFDIHHIPSLYSQHLVEAHLATNTAAELIVRCFAVRTAAHTLHLQAKTLSSHLALGEFYEKIIELVDEFAEVYQGRYGLITNYPQVPPKSIGDGIELMKWFCSWVEENRKGIGTSKDTHLQNIIDEIVALADRTTYKLTYLPT